MKAKKQRKITFSQLETIRQKLFRLQYKRAQIVKQLTPLKITVRKYIQQNMAEIEVYLVWAGKHGMLAWAANKIKRGYFYDAHMGNIQEIITAIACFEKWKAKQH